MFPQVNGVDSGRAGKRKARSQGFSGAKRFAASAVPWRSHGAVGASGGGWWAYGLVVRVRGRRSGTGEMGLEAVLRTGPRGGSGAGVRGALEYVENVFSTWLYASGCSPENEGLGNLTERLTDCLTASLTPRLTRSLTESSVLDGERAGKRAQEARERP